MPRKIRNLTQYACKHCKKAYWSTDLKAGWCDDCRSANRAARAKKRDRKIRTAGQLSLELE